jgi:CHAT domain-containing protein
MNQAYHTLDSRRSASLILQFVSDPTSHQDATEDPAAPMPASELAARLLSVGEAERAALLSGAAAALALPVAWALKDACFAAWSSDPPQALRAAALLAELAAAAAPGEIRGLAAWTGGIAELIEGRMESALARLTEAQAAFEALGQSRTAADTQVSQLIALAMLGRYDEAVDTGRRARDAFVAHGDARAAGKIELNLGNLHFRRDAYADAERHYRAARALFSATSDVELLVMADNGLADVLTWQSRFDEAADLYARALAQAEAAGLRVLQAMLEGNLGWLELSRGDYDRALQHLEQSRRGFAALQLPPRLAVAEQHLADAYLELNLVPEALAIYERAAATFAELGMRFDQAWTLAHRGQALAQSGQHGEAQRALEQAQALFESEENQVCAAMTALTRAELALADGDSAGAGRMAAEAEPVLAEARSWNWWLLARWLRGESARALGAPEAAAEILEAAREAADLLCAPHVARRCLTSLGLLRAAQGDLAGARQSFERAIQQLESQRAALPSEEFRAAFLADKLAPYAELARLCLDDPAGPDAAGALRHVERARARALLEMMAGGNAGRARGPIRDEAEAALLARVIALRAELNWSYAQLQRALMEGDTSPATRERLTAYARERENAILDVTRQLQQGAGQAEMGVHPSAEALDLPALQAALGGHTALVEYFSLDGQLLAFVATDQGVDVVRLPARERDVDAAVDGLRFQTETLRHGAQHMRAHLGVLSRRAQQYLRQLYDLLLRPLEAHIGDRRLAVVPHRAMHYAPFHALHDGQRHVIERREVCAAPSAAVLLHCLRAPAPTPGRSPRALLIGVPDARAPRVRDEVLAVAPLFDRPIILLESQATLAALRSHAPRADILHLACHGQFRPDNPLFSSLRLADSWLTVRDAYTLDLHCGLVVLSACETGVNTVAPGDELIGLARGFFSAGSPSVLVSLWTVDDEATARLMQRFYERLLAGDGPATALRAAQRDLLADGLHPFFWAPFVLMGRW